MMPVIGKVTKQFSTSAQAAQASPTPRNVARLMLAIRNLANNLKGIGVSISPDDLVRAVQGPTPADAGGDRQKPEGVGQAQPQAGQ